MLPIDPYRPIDCASIGPIGRPIPVQTYICLNLDYNNY